MHLGKHFPRDIKQSQKIITPLQCMYIKKHRTGCIRIIGRMHRTAGQVPDQPGIHGTEAELTLTCSLPRALYMIEYPSDLTSREIRIGNQTRFAAYHIGLAFGHDPVYHIRCSAALPYDRIIDRLACRSVPHDSSLALIRDADTRYVLGRRSDIRHRLRSYGKLR